MGNLFVVEIGTFTRKGTLLVQATKYIECGSPVTTVMDHYRRRYSGFDVRVTQVDEVLIEKIKKEPEQKPEPIQEPGPKTEDLTIIPKIEYYLKAQPFKALYSAAVSAKQAWHGAERELCAEVAEFINSKPWVCHIGEDNVNIDYACDNAFVKNLRIEYEVLRKEIEAGPTDEPEQGA